MKQQLSDKMFLNTQAMQILTGGMAKRRLQGKMKKFKTTDAGGNNETKCVQKIPPGVR